jgi:hypothetical protein
MVDDRKINSGEMIKLEALRTAGRGGEALGSRELLRT